MNQLTSTRRAFLAAIGAATCVVAWGDPFPMSAIAMTEQAAAVPASFASGWLMQSSEKIQGDGQALSRAGANMAGWYNVTVPCTVLAGLVAAGEYPDLYHGENLKHVPKERFKPSWWYRKEFTVSSAADAQRAQTWLYFKGINYRANIWLNGKQIGDSKTIVGTYRDFELNITSHLVNDGPNVLAVEVFPPDPKVDLAITFVDWAPAPPDLNMGLWQDVQLRTSGAVAIRYPHVLSDFDPAASSSAKITVLADLVNATDKPIKGELHAQIEDHQTSLQVALGPGETRTVSLPDIQLNSPRLWWPAQLGKPEMYELKLTFAIDNKTSDECTTPFGVRKVTSRLEKNSLLFTINGVDLLILGGGYAPDLLQRRATQENHIRYVLDMNLNTVRLEGKLEDDAFYDICDRLGVMVMPGWCCCSPWERWKNWKDEQTTVASESLRYQIRRARTHPSIIAFLNGSDNHPTEDVEKKYLAIEKELQWPCPTISSATAKKSPVTGESGVKMEGPYKWVPPIYWLTDTKKGGAHGFNTEVGPGAVPPPLESLQTMLPPDHRWPIDEVWNFHCGTGGFANIKDFSDALDARFGKSKSIADFAWKAQAQAYETIRAMYEGFRRNKFNSGGTATGEIQWMLNNAWPSMIWHLYDYYLRPGGAYFATKIACEPVHILYSYDNRSIVVANDTLRDVSSLTASATIFDVDSKLRHEQKQTCNAPANRSAAVFTLPDVVDLSTAYFLRLTLTDANQIVVSVNSYFLSTKPDVLDYKRENKDDWAITPCSSYADFTQLEKLPPVKLTLSELSVEHRGDDDEARVSVTNTASTIALLVRLKLTQSPSGDEILPIRWQDNYFMLLPNESRQITARYRAADAQGKQPVVSVDCFNNGRG